MQTKLKDLEQEDLNKKEDKNEELNKIKSELNEVRKEKENLSEENNKNARDFKKLKDDYDQLSSEKNELDDNLKKSENELSDLKKEIQKLVKDLEKSEKENKILSEEINKLKDNNNIQNNKINENYNNLQNDYNKLEKDLESYKSENETIKNENLELKSQNEKLLSDHNKIKETNEQLLNDVKKKDNVANVAEEKSEEKTIKKVNFAKPMKPLTDIKKEIETNDLTKSISGKNNNINNIINQFNTYQNDDKKIQLAPVNPSVENSKSVGKEKKMNRALERFKKKVQQDYKEKEETKVEPKKVAKISNIAKQLENVLNNRAISNNVNTESVKLEHDKPETNEDFTNMIQNQTASQGVKKKKSKKIFEAED